MKRLIISLALSASLAGCSGGDGGSLVQMQPANPDTTARIVKECLASGLFKQVSGFALSAIPVPVAGVTLSYLLNTGVDKVCANPERFAQVEGTIEWTVKNLLSARNKPS
jgi:hypothetical protein